MTKAVWGGMVVLALLGAGCASALVKTESALYQTIVAGQDAADAVCDVGAAPADACKQFYARLDTIIGSAMAFNRSVREDSYVEVPAMLRALDDLRKECELLFQDPVIRESVAARIAAARALVARLKG